MEFCKAFTGTAKEEGMVIPVIITVYSDRSFSFIQKTPRPACAQKAAAWSRARARGAREGRQRTKKQVEEIARLKLSDLNAKDLAGAIKTSRHGAEHGLEVT